MAATVATYCPSRMVEHPKFKSTQPSRRPPESPCSIVGPFAGGPEAEGDEKVGSTWMEHDSHLISNRLLWDVTVLGPLPL